MAIIGINYKEPNTQKYQSVRISYGEKEEKLFATGNFIKDWYDMRKFTAFELSDSEPYFCHSSSVDHFIMDGAPYDSAYLHMIDDKPVLKYLDRSDSLWFINQRDIVDNGIEFFVPEGTQPTWEELKKMCEK